MTNEPASASPDAMLDAPQDKQPLDATQLKRLLVVAGHLVSELDLEAVLSHLLESARDLAGARYAAIGVLDEQKRALERFVYVGIDEGTRRRIGPLPRGHGILGELIRDRRPLRLARISDHPRSYGFPAEHPAMTTFLGVPVVIDGEAWGNLYLSEKLGGEEFSQRDEDLLVVLADWAAIAVANARSHKVVGDRREVLERAVTGLRATVDLDRELGVQTQLPRVLELVAKRGRALVDARAFLVLLASAEQPFVVSEAAGEVPAEIVGREVAGPSIATDAVRSGIPQKASGLSLGPFTALGLQASEGLLVPLLYRGRSLGVLAAFESAIDAQHGVDEELLLTSFATSAAAAIAATQVVEHEKMRQSLAASEQERRRWARELHDETLQELGALRLMQEGALQVDTADAMRGALVRASQQVQDTISGLEGLITELRPAVLDQIGTGAALEALGQRLGERHSIELHLDVDLADERGDDVERYSAELETTIYRVVQEALNNVLKHADASAARVAVEERGGTVMITVEDDGGGIEAGKIGSGFGLVGMRERVELLGGELHIGSGPRGGTRVSARLPVNRREAGAS